MKDAQKVRASLAAWPGKHHAHAAALAQAGALQAPWGTLLTDHLQLVPQNAGVLDEDQAFSLVQNHPDTRFRLHANVRVLLEHRMADLSNFDEEHAWFAQAARIHALIGAPVYSAHAGRRANASLAQAFDNARRCADLFGSPVAIEGLYPESRGMWLLSSWSEYALLLDAGVPYALDLSHLHILASKTRQIECSLVTELLSSPQCLEVHVSDNDGVQDRHEQVRSEFDALWWMPLLRHIHEDAVVFSEAVQPSGDIGTLSSN